MTEPYDPNVYAARQIRVVFTLYWLYWALLTLSFIPNLAYLMVFFYLVTIVVAFVRASDCHAKVAKSHFRNYFITFVISLFGNVIIGAVLLFSAVGYMRGSSSYSAQRFADELFLGMSGSEFLIYCVVAALLLFIYCTYRIVKGMLRLAEGHAY